MGPPCIPRNREYPGEKTEKTEKTEDDALISAVKALPFSPDDIFRGTGDGTREYTALFTI